MHSHLPLVHIIVITMQQQQVYDTCSYLPTHPLLLVYTYDRDLRENVEKSRAVHRRVEGVIEEDDYALLQDSVLIMDQIEGVFTNPPPTQPR